MVILKIFIFFLEFSCSKYFFRIFLQHGLFYALYPNFENLLRCHLKVLTIYADIHFEEISKVCSTKQMSLDKNQKT